jgi:hypothetical protein
LATAALAITAPLNRRTTISTDSVVANAVTKKLTPSPVKPSKRIGRRP